MISMKKETRYVIYDELNELANNNKLTVITGNKIFIEKIAKEYDGINVFITDGSMSREKMILDIGKNLKYESSQIVKLTKKEIYDEPLPGEEETLHYIIGLAIKHFPHLRYHQVLHNLNIIIPADLNDENQTNTVDEFSVEDEIILHRVKSSRLYKKLMKLEKDEE